MKSVIFALGLMLPWSLFVILSVVLSRISVSASLKARLLCCADTPGQASTNQWAVKCRQHVQRVKVFPGEREAHSAVKCREKFIYPLFKPCLLGSNAFNLSFFMSTPNTGSALNCTMSVQHFHTESTFEKSLVVPL